MRCFEIFFKNYDFFSLGATLWNVSMCSFLMLLNFSERIFLFNGNDSYNLWMNSFFRSAAHAQLIGKNCFTVFPNSSWALMQIIILMKWHKHCCTASLFTVYNYVCMFSYWIMLMICLCTAVVERGVKVELLMSHWAHTRQASHTLRKLIYSTKVPIV